MRNPMLKAVTKFILRADEKILEAVENGAPGPGFRILAQLLTQLGKTPTYLAIVVTTFVLDRALGRQALFLLLATELSSQLLKGAFKRSRPTQLVDKSPLDLNGSFSLPSTHAVNAVAFSLFLSAHFPHPSVVALTGGTALGIAWSRLRLSEHYPTDIIAGAFVGSALAVLAF